VEAHLCGACLRGRPPFALHRSAARYEGAVKEVLLLFKYRRHRPLGKPLARFVHGALGEEESLWNGADGLVPVPLHPRRRRERGFNQAAVLAAELSRLTGIPVWSGALRRTARTPAQTTLSRAERLSNVRGIFQARRPGRLRGRVAVLVDDVFTTGATVRECARTLLRAGAREVRAVTIARA
jgi:ComF family protein